MIRGTGQTSLRTRSSVAITRQRPSSWVVPPDLLPSGFVPPPVAWIEFVGRVSFVRNRPVFRLDDGATVPMRICHCFETPGFKKIRWFLTMPRRDRHLATLICLCNPTNDNFEGFHVVSGIEIGTKYTIKGDGDALFRHGHRLSSLSELPSAARAMAASGGTLEGDLRFVRVQLIQETPTHAGEDSAAPPAARSQTGKTITPCT